MAFFKKPEREETTVNLWLKVQEGSPVIVQILDEHPTEVSTHWMADSSGRKLGFTCPGLSLCPACQRNNQIQWNREHPDYVSKSRRYRLNVLDLTPITVCPECGAEYYGSATPEVCSVDGCNKELGSVEPIESKTVKVLEKGPKFMQQLNALDSEEHPLVGERLRIWEFPIKIIARGSGLDMVTIVHPLMPRDDIDFDEYEKLDLHEIGLQLEPEEIEYLLEGGTYSDLFAARSADAAVEEDEEEEEVPF